MLTFGKYNGIMHTSYEKRRINSAMDYDGHISVHRRMSRRLCAVLLTLIKELYEEVATEKKQEKKAYGKSREKVGITLPSVIDGKASGLVSGPGIIAVA